ncbi:peptide-methionine (S)-S-oxide reductase [Salinimicrobium oceani]|uniref:peptide-methionine (S)-S-oxide reductase n=1 Tax=Salinimicrobium oceani TaxID=2722702 RepID=A0ABX1D3F6_9FLAO|nr:peptide-methionine (S)-S-oxide reductase [Salinimicrobium oceani]NJW53728.1 peptide methionine sulfoxide reductase [Salinimicrobium oceani]
MNDVYKIGLGGGCHWCTEAVFQAVEGVTKVEQGYIASAPPAETFSEAVIVHYLPKKVKLERLLEIHLHTHNSTVNHSFRKKYRSAVYCFSSEKEKQVKAILEVLQKQFEEKLVTQVLPFQEFKASRESIQNYYRKNPDAPFCKRYIEPKLKVLERTSLLSRKGRKD